MTARSPYTRKTEASGPTPSPLLQLLFEARWYVEVALLAYLVLILASFHANDPSWVNASGHVRIGNLGGRLGAWLSGLLLYIFGLSTWWWAVALATRIIRGYRRLSRGESGDTQVVGLYDGMIHGVGLTLMLIGSMGIEYLRLYTLKLPLPRAPGGVLGEVLGSAAQTALGFTGSTLLLLLLFALGVSLYFHVSWLSVSERVGGWIEDWCGFLIRRLQVWRDRRAGQAAAGRREEVLIQERAKQAERAQSGEAPLKIEPSVLVVDKPEPSAQSRQGKLFADPVMPGSLPALELLDPIPPVESTVSNETLEFTSRMIEKKLADFNVEVKVIAAYPGPVITRYEIEPAVGVKGSQIVNLARDLARSLSLTTIRVVETIPGKMYMGLELPNPKRQIVRLAEILGSKAYHDSASRLTVALGKDIAGLPVVADLAKMPHLLVAGTTGSGKSVGINATILSLLYKVDASQVRLILIDPKMLELSVYEGIPHLLAPVVTDMQQAGHALNWAVAEMERRYKLMSKLGVRNLAGYNAKIDEAAKREEHIPNPFSLTPDAPEPLEKLPTIVIVIDELADLMMVVGKKVEELIARIAQKARAAGLHLILATQRPSVDVITGLIKANVPTRIAFQVSSKIDSRTILDQMGAETLLGMGDMLYLPPGTGFPVRVHGAFVSDDEVHRVVKYLKEQGEPNYVEGILDGNNGEPGGADASGTAADGEADTLYDQAVEIVLKNRRASISLVQRHLRIGYNRAARLLEQMERSGLVSAMQPNGNRDIMVPGNSAQSGE